MDVDQAIEKANAAKTRLAVTRPRVNIMSKFFEERQGENGFGEDFEWTLDPSHIKRAKGT